MQDIVGKLVKTLEDITVHTYTNEHGTQLGQSPGIVLKAGSVGQVTSISDTYYHVVSLKFRHLGYVPNATILTLTSCVTELTLEEETRYRLEE